MGLFDSLAGKGPDGNPDDGNPLASILGSVMNGQTDLSGTMSDALNQAGGIEGLKQKAQQMGLGDIVGSWIGTGENRPIDGEQAAKLLGHDNASQMAQKLGIDMGKMGPLIAALLPVIIDKLTPKGHVPADANQGEGLSGAIGALLKGGDLSSMLGSFMGGKKA